MASKLQFYSILAERAATDITDNRGNWTNFLDTAARLYKYSFPDQLLIYAQRPDAIACAPIEMWNETFNRWVRRGSKGIALIDDSGNYPRLKYVFDVADTESSLYNARPVYLWEMRQEHREPVLEALAKVYDDMGETLADSFRSIANQLAKEYYDDNAREIRYSAENSYLEDFDEFNLRVTFENALSVSIAYTLMSRCGFDTGEYFDDDDFQYIFDFNTPDMVYALGTATSELSEQVLRDIELVIKKYERQHAAERSNENERNNNIHASRGTSDTGFEIVRTGERTDRTVRTVRENEENISERTSGNNIQHNVTEGNAVPTLTGNGGSGELKDGTDNEETDFDESDTGQNNRPDGLDGDDEHIESTSGGDSLERSDLHLNELNKTPSEQDKITVTDGVFSISETYSQLGNTLLENLSASSIKLDEVDTVLRTGGNDNASHLRITSYFSKGKSLEENTNFLKSEYLSGRYGHRAQSGGKGFQFGTQQTSVWFDDNGITIGRGKSAIYSNDRVIITWEQAAARVKELFDAGQYVSHDFLDEARDNEKLELADKLWDFYRDDMGYIPEEWKSHNGNPGDVEIIKSLLDDLDERQAILNRLEIDVETWRNDPERRYWHRPERILTKMRDCMIPPNGFPAADFQSVGYMSFITDDEVDERLSNGSNFSEGKYRILSYFLNEHTPKEKIDFLKKEYGTGGGSWVDGGWHDHDPSKGITLKRSGCQNINLNWNRVARRIDELIQSGRYMTQPELDHLYDYERLILARQIKDFYYELPDEYRTNISPHFQKNLISLIRTKKNGKQSITF